MLRPPLGAITVRVACDADGDALGHLIAGCFAEHPSCVFDRARELPELDAIATHFTELGGVIWVAEARDELVGSLGLRPAGPATVELLKVYVATPWRGRGLAQALLARGLAEARARRARRVVLWSDTRFTRGHAFYAKAGFERTGQTRFLADLSDTWEYRLVRRLDDLA